MTKWDFQIINQVPNKKLMLRKVKVVLKKLLEVEMDLYLKRVVQLNELPLITSKMMMSVILMIALQNSVEAVKCQELKVTCNQKAHTWCESVGIK